MSGGDYLADATPDETWNFLAGKTGAALVDVRTAAEWSFVGIPDVASLGAPFLRVEWQVYPSMQANPAFVDTVAEELAAAGCSRESQVFFICRSGARSASAAAAMTAAGFARCYNVEGGFEGSRDSNGHRGMLDGWKAAGLPWSQS